MSLESCIFYDLVLFCAHKSLQTPPQSIGVTEVFRFVAYFTVCMFPIVVVEEDVSGK